MSEPRRDSIVPPAEPEARASVAASIEQPGTTPAIPLSQAPAFDADAARVDIAAIASAVFRVAMLRAQPQDVQRACALADSAAARMAARLAPFVGPRYPNAIKLGAAIGDVFTVVIESVLTQRAALAVKETA